MNNYINPVDIEFDYLLKCDNQKLSEIFHFFFKAVVEPKNDQVKQEAFEFLLLMEEAPELRKRVGDIRGGIQKKMEEKMQEIKTTLEKTDREKTDLQKWLNQLKQEHKQIEHEIDQKKRKIAQMRNDLEITRKQVKEIRNSER